MHLNPDEVIAYGGAVLSRYRKAARRERDSLENRLVAGGAAVSWQVQV